jgi:hypothetical protein
MPPLFYGTSPIKGVNEVKYLGRATEFQAAYCKINQKKFAFGWDVVQTEVLIVI